MKRTFTWPRSRAISWLPLVSSQPGRGHLSECEHGRRDNRINAAATLPRNRRVVSELIRTNLISASTPRDSKNATVG